MYLMTEKTIKTETILRHFIKMNKPITDIINLRYKEIFMISGTSNIIKYYKYLKHYFEVELVPICFI